MPPLLDHTGQRFGKLLVLRRGPNRYTKPTWVCRCDCGREVTVTGQALRRGQKNCAACRTPGWPKGKPRVDLLGHRFGKLLVVALAPRELWSDKARWCVECDCGNFLLLQATSIQRQKGCAQCGRTGRPPLHGMTGTPTYVSWRAMIQRCTDPNAAGGVDWPLYGGRGITVDPSWLGPGGFQQFVADVGLRPEGKTLDRIDVDGNYEPSNCRWATPSEQARNKRPMKVDDAAMAQRVTDYLAAYEARRDAS